MVFEDHFEGAEGTDPDPTFWRGVGDKPRRDGWWLNSQYYLDGASNLVIKTEKLPDPDNRYVTGGVETEGKYVKKFGYFVCRAKLPRTWGHWPSFWLMGKSVNTVNGSGTDGTEIDIFEGFKFWWPEGNDRRINHGLHYDGYGAAHQHLGKQLRMADFGDPDASEYHTFAVWWTTDKYRFYVDGILTWETTFGGVSQVAQHLMLTDEVGIVGDAKKTGGGTVPISQAALPDYYLVDYVRVYDLVDA